MNQSIKAIIMHTRNKKDLIWKIVAISGLER